MAIRAFFQCSPPDGDPEDRLRKVRFIYDHVRNKSREYWQPNRHVCIDERMVPVQRSECNESVRQTEAGQVGVQELHPVRLRDSLQLLLRDVHRAEMYRRASMDSLMIW